MEKTKKIITPKLTEVKLINFTAEELKMISLLKVYTNEKTAAGMFKKILTEYSIIIENHKRLIEMEQKYFQLIQALKNILTLITKEK